MKEEPEESKVEYPKHVIKEHVVTPLPSNAKHEFPNRQIVFCGATPEPFGFLFQDKGHALICVMKGTMSQPCEACMEAIKKEAGSVLSPDDLKLIHKAGCIQPDDVLPALWMEFSEIQQATFLNVDDAAVKRFVQWCKTGADSDAWA